MSSLEVVYKKMSILYLFKEISCLVLVHNGVVVFSMRTYLLLQPIQKDKEKKEKDKKEKEKEKKDKKERERGKSVVSSECLPFETTSTTLIYFPLIQAQRLITSSN